MYLKRQVSTYEYDLFYIIKPSLVTIGENGSNTPCMCHGIAECRGNNIGPLIIHLCTDLCSQLS